MLEENSKEPIINNALIEKVLLSTVEEQKRARRWGIFFKLTTLAWLFFIAFNFSGSKSSHSGSGDRYAALITINGVIAADESANAENIINSLNNAFDDTAVKGIILEINSPGGSPVQSGYIYDEIRRLKKNNGKKKVYAVISDIGASGAYYIASAADEIYANRASLVGSIGAYIASFGASELLGKIGVTRRFYKSGEFKGFSDPFLPEVPEVSKHITDLVESIHQQFIDSVIMGRGDRLLVENNPLLFSGMIWSGEQALELGLVDGLESTGFVLRELIGTENVVDYTFELSPIERIARQIGVGSMTFLSNHLGLGNIVLR